MRYWVMILMLPAFLAAQTVDIFFSEYIEGSGSNKALEIFNPTDTVVDLSGYIMRGTANSATDWEYLYTFPDTAKIAPHDVYVIVDANADQAMKDVADWITSGYEVGFNGNDARGLFKIVGTDTILIDVIGDPNNPNGDNYAVAGIANATKDHTLIRKPEVLTGNPDWSSSAGTNTDDSEWIVEPQDYFSDLGQHNYAAAETTVDIFFSEYIEGSGSNKALEIFNPTDTVVDLSGYIMRGTANSATDWEYLYTFPDTAKIAPHDVYVIVDANADQAMKDVADWITSGYEVGFNGNDARGLFKIVGTDTILIDVIGDPNNPNGDNYAVAGIANATKDHTLIRKPEVLTGNPDWSSSAGTNTDDSEWIVEPQDYFSDLGRHTYGQQTDNPPVIEWMMHTPTIPEENENLEIKAVVTDDQGIASVTLNFTIDGAASSMGMTAAQGDTFVATIDASNYSTGQALTYSITATDNGGNSTTSSEERLLIGTVPIRKLHELDNDFSPVFAGYMVKIVGVATVGDSTFSNYHLDVYVQDTTGGVNIFGSGLGNTDFNVGDQYQVIGVVGMYNGKTEVLIDSLSQLTYLSTVGEPEPMVLSIAEIMSDPESYEGMLVRIQHVYNTGNGDAWPAEGSNANVEISDDSTNTFTMRIDKDTDIDGSSEPTWPKDVVGVISQYDNSAPYDAGYQILPRSLNDIQTATAIEPVAKNTLPTHFRLFPNFPNPFNPTTHVVFDVPVGNKDRVQVAIYNVLAQKVVELVNDRLSPGHYEMEWTARDSRGNQVPAGIYFLVLKAGNFQQVQKMILMK